MPEFKITAGAKFSDKPTLKSGFSSKTSFFTKGDATINGKIGFELKTSMPYDNINERSYSFGFKLGDGNNKYGGQNGTIGVEKTVTGSSLATDKNDGGY